MRLLPISLLASAVFAADANYSHDVEQFRALREASLRRDNSWLTVVGLFRLKEGDNPIGAKEEIELPAPAPAHLGKIVLSKGQTVYYANGKPGTLLRPDLDTIAIRTVSFLVIQRGDEYFVRVRDNNSQLRRDFTGLKWFPIDPAWKITAKFTPYPTAKKMMFDSQNGVKQPMDSPGYVTFTREGKEFRLGTGLGRQRADVHLP